MADDFLDRLRQAREAATPGPWEQKGWDNASFMNTYGIVAENSKVKIAVDCNCEDAPNCKGEDWELICLLVNNAKKIELLIAAATAVSEGRKQVDLEGIGTPLALKLDPWSAPMWELHDALAALNEGDG